MRYTCIVVLVLVSVTQVNQLSAEVIDSENFESFAAVPVAISTDVDWSVLDGQETNVSVVNNALSYINGVVSVSGGNQALQFGPNLPSATTNNLANWTFASTTTDSVWFSFLLQSSENASTSIPNEDDSRDFFQMLIGSDDNHSQSLSVVIDHERGGPPGGDHNFRARAGSWQQNRAGFTDATGSVLHEPMETYLLVGNIQKASDQYESISIYVNPDSASPPSLPTAMATWEPVDLTSVQQLTIRISHLDEDDFYLIDQLVLGESYQDVVTVVPEPTALSLLLLGSICMSAARRQTDKWRWAASNRRPRTDALRRANSTIEIRKGNFRRRNQA